MTSRPLTAQVALPILAAGAVAFFTLGVIQAMYGPAFSLFQQRFGVGAGSVGIIASAHFFGSALGPPLTGLLLKRLSVRRVVMLALLVLAAGATLIAAAPLWPLAVAGALVAGLGLGGISGALNASYANLGTQPVNLVNAVFGVGSVASPLVVTSLGAHSPSWPFLFVVACCGLTLVAARAWGFPEVPPRSATAAATPRGKVVLFALILAVYTCLEVGNGAWTSKHLEALGVLHPAAFVSGYWGGLTAGRILTGLLGGRVAQDKLVLLTAVGATLGALLEAYGPPALAPWAFVLTGLMLGPIFATSLAWMSRYISARLVPFLLMSGSVGGVLMPALLGWLFARYGAGIIPVTLAGTGAVLCACIALTIAQLRQTRAL